MLSRPASRRKDVAGKPIPLGKQISLSLTKPHSSRDGSQSVLASWPHIADRSNREGNRSEDVVGWKRGVHWCFASASSARARSPPTASRFYACLVEALLLQRCQRQQAIVQLRRWSIPSLSSSTSWRLSNNGSSRRRRHGTSHLQCWLARTSQQRPDHLISLGQRP